MPTLTEMLGARTHSVDPFVRAVALYALGERGAASEETLARLERDEHELVRETALHLRARKGEGKDEVGAHSSLITVEKMIALRSAPLFSSLAPEGLAELARASIEDDYAPGENLCVEGEPGNEVFILLTGDVKVLVRDDNDGLEKVIASEKAGGFIGEMAVLDPAPRSATVIAGASGVRVLRLDGSAFREALNTDPAIATGVIRTLAARLRGRQQ